MSDAVVAVRAGAFYALIVFGVGFVLGTVRVVFAAPRLGETIAVILETPLILVASWYVCQWCVEQFQVRRTVPMRSVMGAVAFAVLMAAEFAFAVVAFGRPLGEQLGAYSTAAGGIGLAAQIVFALFPIIQVWRR
jgi:hypothetical protein